MILELYEGNKSLYLCIVNNKGGCLAIRLFDCETGDAKDRSGPMPESERTATVQSTAQWLASEPDCWNGWRGGLAIPGLVYEREVLNTAKLAAHHDSGEHWHLDRPVSTWQPATQAFIKAYNEALDAVADTAVPDCEACDLADLWEEENRPSGLLDEEG